MTITVNDKPIFYDLIFLQLLQLQRTIEDYPMEQEK
jgi:hypothetical protein